MDAFFKYIQKSTAVLLKLQQNYSSARLSDVQYAHSMVGQMVW